MVKYYWQSERLFIRGGDFSDFIPRLNELVELYHSKESSTKAVYYKVTDIAENKDDIYCMVEKCQLKV